MFCTRCGHPNRDDARFCAKCGAPLHEDATLSLTPVEAEEEGHDEFPFPHDELEAGQALLLVKRGPNAGSTFLMSEAETSVGRNPESAVFLDDITVSRAHAVLRAPARRRLVRTRRRQPERHVRERRAGRPDEARLGRRGADRQVQADVLRGRGVRCRQMAGTRNYQSIGEVLVSVKTEFPDITISKIRFLEARGPDRARTHPVRLPEVLRGRRRAPAVDPADAARRVPPVEGHQGTAARADARQDERRGGPPEPSGGDEASAAEEMAEPPTGPADVARGDVRRHRRRPGADQGARVVRHRLHARPGRSQLLRRRRLHRPVDREGLLPLRDRAAPPHDVRHFADREASFFEAIVAPMLRQRNPDARRKAAATRSPTRRVTSRKFKQALLRTALRDHLQVRVSPLATGHVAPAPRRSWSRPCRRRSRSSRVRRRRRGAAAHARARRTERSRRSRQASHAGGRHARARDAERPRPRSCADLDTGAGSSTPGSTMNDPRPIASTHEDHDRAPRSSERTDPAADVVVRSRGRGVRTGTTSGGLVHPRAAAPASGSPFETSCTAAAAARRTTPPSALAIARGGQRDGVRWRDERAGARARPARTPCSARPTVSTTAATRRATDLVRLTRAADGTTGLRADRRRREVRHDPGARGTGRADPEPQRPAVALPGRHRREDRATRRGAGYCLDRDRRAGRTAAGRDRAGRAATMPFSDAAALLNYGFDGLHAHTFVRRRPRGRSAIRGRDGCRCRGGATHRGGSFRPSRSRRLAARDHRRPARRASPRAAGNGWGPSRSRPRGCTRRQRCRWWPRPAGAGASGGRTPWWIGAAGRSVGRAVGPDRPAVCRLLRAPPSPAAGALLDSPAMTEVASVLFGARTSAAGWRSSAAQIAGDYVGREPVLVTVLKGGAMFLADLIREIDLPVESHFMAISRVRGTPRSRWAACGSSWTSTRPIGGGTCSSWRTSSTRASRSRYLLSVLKARGPGVARGVHVARQDRPADRAARARDTWGSIAPIGSSWATASTSCRALPEPARHPRRSTTSPALAGRPGLRSFHLAEPPVPRTRREGCPTWGRVTLACDDDRDGAHRRARRAAHEPADRAAAGTRTVSATSPSGSGRPRRRRSRSSLQGVVTPGR